ncbi:MAG: SDR family oxidoreductase [Firmicutes bacterium]|nr:SDR family oxidoreductase [Bacillota bacterium]MCL5039397.1 SDR family oxidoreductase [Bacillota bacterium]
MLDLKGKTALVTGASSGIGQATVRRLVQAGGRVIVAARRTERLAALREELGDALFPITLDVRQREHVEKILGELPTEWSAISILVNNAGLALGLEKLAEANVADWEGMIDTNVKGLLYVTHTILPGMLARGEGHIINLGSIAGHEAYPGGSVYCATKSSVHAISESLRKELVDTPLRVTEISPGMVETEFSLVRFHGDKDRAARVYHGVEPLTADDIADAILYAATRPPHVNINEMIIMATNQAGATIVSRKQ